MIHALSGITRSEFVDGNRFRNERGLSYSNYMIFFFITKALFYTGSEADAAAELAKRTGNLIEWNIINYRNRVYADEERMAAELRREDRFRLSEMKTDFSIALSADLRMLFLSMPLAQRGINRVIPPGTMTVTAADYRGY